MMELWKDISGYEGLYQVSNLGNVRSIEREVRQGKYGKMRSVGGYNIRPTDNGYGYFVVGLRSANKRKNFYIHRLVADAFCNNDCGYTYVNHKDYNTKNNHADNLEWCTQRQNILYSVDRMRKPRKKCKKTNTGEKYIRIKNGKYRLIIPRIIDKSFPSLESAIAAREVVYSGEKYFTG